MEFQAIYDNWIKLKSYVESREIKCTVLHPKCSFLYKMFDKPVNIGKANEHKGYSWCGGMCRWGTTDKLNALDKYCEEHNAYCYIGIAADETLRLEKERKDYKLFPLAEWKMTESECLKYCRDIGIKWLENDVDLYDILDRVSCWCCSNKNHWELYNIWRHLPQYWHKLCDLQSRLNRPMKNLIQFSICNIGLKMGIFPNINKIKNKGINYDKSRN